MERLFSLQYDNPLEIYGNPEIRDAMQRRYIKYFGVPLDDFMIMKYGFTSYMFLKDVVLFVKRLKHPSYKEVFSTLLFIAKTGEYKFIYYDLYVSDVTDKWKDRLFSDNGSLICVVTYLFIEYCLQRGTKISDDKIELYERYVISIQEAVKETNGSKKDA